MSEDALEVPLILLRALEHLPALVGEIGLATVAGDVLEEDGLEGGAVALALAGLFTLGLLEVELDGGGLGELLGVDGVGDAGPEGQGLVGGLLFVGREDLGRDVERVDVDNDMLVFGRDGFLQILCVSGGFGSCCHVPIFQGAQRTKGLGPRENMTFSLHGP